MLFFTIVMLPLAKTSYWDRSVLRSIFGRVSESTKTKTYANAEFKNTGS